MLHLWTGSVIRVPGPVQKKQVGINSFIFSVPSNAFQRTPRSARAPQIQAARFLRALQPDVLRCNQDQIRLEGPVMDESKREV